MQTNITTRDGLLISADGKVIELPDADKVARNHGFQHAEQMVKALEAQRDPREGWTSASNAEADLICPGRHQAQKNMPDSSSSDAERGNRVHAALAANNPNLTDTLEEREMVEACQTIEKKVVGKYFNLLEGQTSNPIREKRLWVKAASGLRHSGQPDAVHIHGNKALIVDYKSGNSDVPESPRNLQLRDLAVLVWLDKQSLESVAVCIIQPLVTWEPEICEYSKLDIATATVELEQRMKACNAPNAPRIAGDKQCKFCKAKATCVEYNRFAAHNLPMTRSLVDVPLSNWTGDDYAAFLDKFALAQQWLDDAKEAAKVWLASGREIPGFALKPGATRETIKDAQTVFDRFSAVGGSAEAFMAAVSVTKGKLKESLAAVTGQKGKRLNEELEKLLAGCTDEKQTAPSIVKV